MNYQDLIPAILSAIIAIVTILENNKNNTEIINTKLTELEKRVGERSDSNMQLIDTKITNLANDVQEHNEVIKRTFKLETKVDNISVMINKLEKKMEDCKNENKK